MLHLRWRLLLTICSGNNENFYLQEDKFAWTDGSAVNYVNWMSNQPDHEDKGCVEAHTYRIEYLYKWFKISCESKRVYICSVKKSKNHFHIQNIWIIIKNCNSVIFNFRVVKICICRKAKSDIFTITFTTLLLSKSSKVKCLFFKCAVGQDVLKINLCPK